PPSRASAERRLAPPGSALRSSGSTCGTAPAAAKRSASSVSPQLASTETPASASAPARVSACSIGPPPCSEGARRTLMRGPSRDAGEGGRGGLAADALLALAGDVQGAAADQRAGDPERRRDLLGEEEAGDHRHQQ